ncbi:MAG: hypothetical protein M3O50_15195 [Myxococcota bacterium]|nr:hypothetical protein [Myxococcota bacterium]
MKRLVDEETRPGTPEGRLAELVRAARPFEPVPFRRQRVLAHLLRKPARGHRIFRASIAIALALGAAAAAAATLDRQWTRHESSFTPVTAVPPARQAAIARPPAAHGSAPAAEEARTAEETHEVSPAPVAFVDHPKQPPSGVRLVPRPPAAPDSRAAARARPPGEDDPTGVLDAIRTLRNGGDASRAAGLLDGYLRIHPNGVLSEDALALSIEAADARHDGRAAADYGERYLKQFPAGRFRGIAAQAVQRRDP